MGMLPNKDAYFAMILAISFRLLFLPVLAGGVFLWVVVATFRDERYL